MQITTWDSVCAHVCMSSVVRHSAAYGNQNVLLMMAASTKVNRGFYIAVWRCAWGWSCALAVPVYHRFDKRYCLLPIGLDECTLKQLTTLGQKSELLISLLISGSLVSMLHPLTGHSAHVYISSFTFLDELLAQIMQSNPHYLSDNCIKKDSRAPTWSSFPGQQRLSLADCCTCGLIQALFRV